MSSRLSRKARRALIAVATLSVALPLSGPTTAQAAPEPAPSAGTAAVESSAPLRLWSHPKVEYWATKNRVWSDLGIKLIAQNQPLELWSHRTSYDEPIRTVWRSPAGDVALPDGTLRDFHDLRGFLKLSFAHHGTGKVKRMTRPACLNGPSQRVTPDAPATSPYPSGCWAHPFGIGAVQAVQAGWATQVLTYDRPMRLERGRYRVTATIGAPYAQAFGLTPEEATTRLTLIVRKAGRGNHPTASAPQRPTQPAPVAPQPAAHEPATDSAGEIPATMPDLRSLPAFAIKTSRNGRYLQFSANVWNGGDSPLVVDGFRREDESVMDAYQYFFDADGNQTGYQLVGEMEWDNKPSHQHWHFEDFARYSLLDRNQAEAVRSKKEAFCLANTDPIDQTVPNADWDVENDDLSTSCGEYESLSIREVLSSGWGDTYSQFRAGQSFRIDTLPNGVYWIAIMANPDNRLVESATDNNLSLRKVILKGRDRRRRVVVPAVGLVVEPEYAVPSPEPHHRAGR